MLRDSLHIYEIKPKPNRLCLILSVITAVVFVCMGTYLLVFNGQTSPVAVTVSEYAKVPKVYARQEASESDDRDVFQEFRTSFLPPEEIFLASRLDANATSDVWIWGGGDDVSNANGRVKRMSSHEHTGAESIGGWSDVVYVEDDTDSDTEDDIYDGTEDYADQTDIDDNLPKVEQDTRFSSDQAQEAMVEGQGVVDRGPLDDVVEQIRGQPELEEAEILNTPHKYKPVHKYSGIHAFWKGEGDKMTIRKTQADIMKAYMDVDADPCQDFYQYACGNWALLNPIPADKAGYDTFEMLRENLDAVLKELLEFKEQKPTKSTKKPDKLKGLETKTHKPFLKTNHKHKEIAYALEIDKLSSDDAITQLEAVASFLNNNASSTEHKNLQNRLKAKIKSAAVTGGSTGVLTAGSDELIDDKAKSKVAASVSLTENQQISDYNRRTSYALEDDKKGTVWLKANSTLVPQFSQNRSELYIYPRTRRYLHRIQPYTKKNHQINRKNDKVTKYTGSFTQKSKKDKKVKKTYAKKFKSFSQTKKDKKMVSPIGRNLLSYQHHVTKRNLPAVSKIAKDGKNNLNDPAQGDAVLKARFLFKSCMNYDILANRGHKPLLDLLQTLGGWPILTKDWRSDQFDWLTLMAKLRLYNNDILLSEWVGPDIKNSNEFVIQFDQTSLGLPTRDYFLQSSNKVYLDAYKEYLIKLTFLLGGKKDHVIKCANNLIDFETKLARITSAPEERRNVSELYRRMTLQQLEKLVPEVKWRKYLCIVLNRTVHSNETVVLFALSYVRQLVRLISQTDPATLANYLLWRFVRHRVNNLDDRFQSAKQQFYFVLFGREQSPPRWKNCISQVNSNMGMALGSMFVRKYFDEISKNDTLLMTREIQQSFRELLNLTDWIDGDTKTLAARKVDAMMLRIGYPDFILNKQELDERYKEVLIHPDNYFENILNILQHLTKMEQSRLGQPVNKTLWNTAPAVVNAYYSRNKNQIMFPAGILQPPFYHRHFPRSLNYGGIGVVIGHEITHGFDDKGRLFDCDGNLHRWWSDSAIENFHRRAQCLIDQYGRYVVPEVNMKLDGVNTQGENIADNGGVTQAFRAYKRWLKRNGANDETLPGLNHTHTQLFFLNFAQVWCGAMRPEAMRNKLKTAVHSPGRFRVIGTLSNSYDFAREFKCPLNSPMNPQVKCNVW